MKEKVNDLVRLHEEMQEKLKTASYSEQIQILALVPDKFSWMYYSEYFNVFECLVWTSHEIKKVGGILAKPFLKKGKTITTETPHSCNKRLWRWQFQCLKRETMLVWVREYINKNFATCKSCILLSKKIPKWKYWVLNVLCLETQMVCSGWLKSDSLCFRL